MPTDSILVVDDEDSVRDLLMNFLKLKGYRMSDATSGEEALTLLDQNPDLLITDFKMSGMDGLCAGQKFAGGCTGQARDPHDCFCGHG